MLLVALGNAHTIVGHADDGLAVLLPCLEMDMSALPPVFDGVGDEVVSARDGEIACRRLAERAVLGHVVKRSQHETEWRADVVRRVDKERDLLVVVSRLQSVAVPAPRQIDERQNDEQIDCPSQEGVPPRTLDDKREILSVDDAAVGTTKRTYVESIASRRYIGISEALQMRHRDPLLVIALKEILVADVVLKAIVDAFKVDSEGILRIGQTDASLAQHVEDTPSHDTVACQLSVERQYRGHPELCRIVRGQHGSRGEQYTAIVATEQQLTFG